MSTWFAIHVKPGTEAQAVDLLRDVAKDSGLEELFCPMSVIELVKHGELVAEELPMIPGCIVAIAPSKWELRHALRKADGLMSLYSGDTRFDAMGEEEAELIGMFTEPGKRIAEMSEGVVDNGRMSIRLGPLTGHEQMVRRYIHRKKRAILAASVAGKPADVQLGLWVTRDESRVGNRYSK